MEIEEQIDEYIGNQPASKGSDMAAIHRVILEALPGCKLWYLNGKDSEGKIVTNPNVGYGSYHINYANGTTKEFYQVGMSANSTGISVYIMGLNDKTFLAKTYGETLGKASVTGYCIKFKKLADINLDVLGEAITHHLNKSQ